MLLPMAASAQTVNAPQDGSCERYGCWYGHNPPPLHYVRPGATPPSQQVAYALTTQVLPDGPDGRFFSHVQWPEGYNPARRAMWDRVAACESGGDWYISTGNGYYGGVQFSHSSWHYVGGGQYAQYPHHAWPEQQIAIAERLLQTAPYARHWPHCGPRAGLTR